MPVKKRSPEKIYPKASKYSSAVPLPDLYNIADEMIRDMDIWEFESDFEKKEKLKINIQNVPKLISVWKQKRPDENWFNHIPHICKLAQQMVDNKEILLTAQGALSIFNNKPQNTTSYHNQNNHCSRLSNEKFVVPPSNKRSKPPGFNNVKPSQA
eukprot:UN26047